MSTKTSQIIREILDGPRELVFARNPNIPNTRYTTLFCVDGVKAMLIRSKTDGWLYVEYASNMDNPLARLVAEVTTGQSTQIIPSLVWRRINKAVAREMLRAHNLL